MTEEKERDFQGMLDTLTGIYNRIGFNKFTREMIEQHPEMQFCLIYWNVRRFKVLNNMFGWHTGDEILIRLADSMKKILKDEIATYGRMERDNFICCVSSEVISRGNWSKMGDIHYAVGDMDYHSSCCYGSVSYTHLRAHET